MLAGKLCLILFGAMWFDKFCAGHAAILSSDALQRWAEPKEHSCESQVPWHFGVSVAGLYLTLGLSAALQDSAYCTAVLGDHHLSASPRCRSAVYRHQSAS